MNKLKVDDLKKLDDLWVIDKKDVVIGFSNAENDRSFNRHTQQGVDNLFSIKEEFNAEDIVYIRQVHSDTVLIYEGNRDKFIENEGDGIITEVPKTIIGSFTADCVPVILVDNEKKVISAVHSGWKGTFKHISSKTVYKMINEFGCDPKKIEAYIGAHIRQCCYEVSHELKNKFIDEFSCLDRDKLFIGRNLNMELCIESDLIDSGLDRSNINSLELCTHCEKTHKLFSYRGSNGTYGRLFSFCYIK